MRIVTKHMNLLHRHIFESVEIERGMADPEACLNGKSEWGGSKLPKLDSVTQRATKTSREMSKRNTKNGSEKQDWTSVMELKESLAKGTEILMY